MQEEEKTTAQIVFGKDANMNHEIVIEILQELNDRGNFKIQNLITVLENYKNELSK